MSIIYKDFEITKHFGKIKKCQTFPKLFKVSKIPALLTPLSAPVDIFVCCCSSLTIVCSGQAVGVVDVVDTLLAGMVDTSLVVKITLKILFLFSDNFLVLISPFPLPRQTDPNPNPHTRMHSLLLEFP